MAITLTGSDGAWTVSLNQPESRNALSNDALNEIVDALKEVEANEATRCVVLSGTDTVFASGADLAELAGQEHLEAFLGSRGDMWRAVREIRLPMIAAVSGYCLGGGFELAMACDVLVADPSAKFGLPETALGLVPGAGGTRALSFSAGPKLAADVVFSGRRLDAREALAFGIASRISEPGGSLDLAQSIAGEIATRPRAALVLAKQAIVEARESLDGLASDRAAFHLALSSSEARERIHEFLAGRTPRT